MDLNFFTYKLYTSKNALNCSNQKNAKNAQNVTTSHGQEAQIEKKLDVKKRKKKCK